MLRLIVKRTFRVIDYANNFKTSYVTVNLDSPEFQEEKQEEFQNILCYG